VAVSFFRGQQLGKGDLNIFLDGSNGTPVNAAEISYALFDFTTGREALLGPPRRQPANPSVGEYYASVIIPLDANLGNYRVRWTFRELVGGPVQQVLQEFVVANKSVVFPTGPEFSEIERDCIRRLRILLRDNCVGEEETIELDVDGEKMVLSMGYLWEALHDLNPPQ
jgi:hypothetical protein